MSGNVDPLIPPDALCERCWQVCLPGEQVAKLGHIVGSTLHGDIQWAFTFLHPYDRDEGCVRNPASIWD